MRKCSCGLGATKRKYTERRKTKTYTAYECDLVKKRLARKGDEGWEGEHPDTLKYMAQKCGMTLSQLAEEVHKVRRRLDVKRRARERYDEKHPWVY